MRNKTGKESEEEKVAKYRQRLNVWLNRLYGISLQDAGLTDNETLQAFRDGVTSYKLAQKCGEEFDLTLLN